LLSFLFNFFFIGPWPCVRSTLCFRFFIFPKYIRIFLRNILYICLKDILIFSNRYLYISPYIPRYPYIPVYIPTDMYAISLNRAHAPEHISCQTPQLKQYLAVNLIRQA
jgi:hypothetical protein